MTELNPNHEVTQAIREQWHKLCALAVMKAGGHIIITSNDIANMPNGGGIAVQELEDGIHLFLVDAVTAAQLARKEGGLPT